MAGRLLDAIMRNTRTERGRRIRESVQGCVPFIIDNVAQYVFGDAQQSITWQDIPNIAPPFASFWMEYTDRRQGRELQTGAAVYAARLPEDRDELFTEATRHGEKFAEALLGYVDETPDAKWLLNFVIFDRRSFAGSYLIDEKRASIEIVGRMQILVGADGSRASENVVCEAYDVFDKPIPFGTLIGAVIPHLLAISFMHCRNVVRAERRAPRAERRRAAKEKQEQPLVTYKTLVIEPMTKVLDTEGAARTQGTAKAMHICRGHFKTFDEKPLFGRVRGMFFWHDQVRATKSDRAVAKRYSVNALAAVGGMLLASPSPPTRRP